MALFDIIPPFTERVSVPKNLTDRWRGLTPHNYLGSPDSYSLPCFHKRATRETVSDLEIDISSRFGRRVRELRQERHLTQTEMAKKFGIDRSYISDLERGRKSISLPMVEVIALGMNVSIAILFEDL